MSFKDKYFWAIGVEHEMQIFSLGDKILKHYDLVDTEKHAKHILMEWDKLKKKFPLKNRKKYYNFIQDVVMRKFEQTGRKCDGKWIIKPLHNSKDKVIKMPEFVSDRPFDKRCFEDYCKDILKQQDLFMVILRECSHLKKEIKDDFLVPFPLGMSNYIKARGVKQLQTDYLGSFHITITLPFKETTTNKQFIDAHKNFANQVQWIEPLLIPGFFSGDDKAIGSKDRLIKGSWRVATIGWGNFAGSDVRKFDKGIGRMSNLKFNWRKDMRFKGKKQVNYCKKLAESVRLREPGAVSGFSSNFRTFGGPDHASGYPMEKPNGVELRIFDNISTKYTPNLCRILTYIADNSRKHKTTIYVYHDKDWVKSLDNIMMEGWKAEVTKGYVTKLRRALGIKINTKSLRAWDILNVINKELFYKNKNGIYSKLLLKKAYTKPTYIKCINRESLENGFILKLIRNTKLRSNLNKLYINLPKEFDLKIFEEYLFKYLSKKYFSNSVDDMVYLLETMRLIKIKIVNGKIIKINKLTYKNTLNNTKILSNYLAKSILSSAYLNQIKF